MIAKLLIVSLLAMIVVVSGCVQEAAPQDNTTDTSQDTAVNTSQDSETADETANDTDRYEDVGYW